MCFDLHRVEESRRFEIARNVHASLAWSLLHSLSFVDTQGLVSLVADNLHTNGTFYDTYSTYSSRCLGHNMKLDVPPTYLGR